MRRHLPLLARSFVITLGSRLRHGPGLPSWSFLFECVTRYLRLYGEETAAWSWQRLRADLDASRYPRDALRRVDCHDELLGEVPTRSYAPKAGARPGRVLFFHGGSFIIGSAKTTHADLLAALAAASGRIVHGVDYRLAPEHPYPAQLQDARSAYFALLEGGVDPRTVVLAGDSAGANLALALALELRGSGRQARALCLLSPWTDLRMSKPSFESNAAFDYGSRALLLRQAAVYAGTLALSDPRVSPALSDLTQLPPTFIGMGDAEILKDDVLALAARLPAAGVQVELHRAPDMPHNPVLFHALHREGRAALAATASFIDVQLARA